MGGSIGSPLIEEQRRKWKMLMSTSEVRKLYEKERTVKKDAETELLEFRVLLDDPIAQPYLGNYAKETHSLGLLMFWFDCQDYCKIPTADFRRSKAWHIYHKYIRSGTVLEIGGIEACERDRIDAALSSQELDETLFETQQIRCFMEMYQNIFVPFRKSPLYVELLEKIGESYNNVSVDDFEYISLLGQGGFGFVVLCQKKTTGRYYAMKIQTKLGLLRQFSRNLKRIAFEKQALASCRHPFIINLDYAFQTESMALMALELASAGDLHTVLCHLPNHRLSLDRVRFYAAEIVCALAHLHGLGLIYRDLKPGNILLCEDGHIKLADLGGVLDTGGKILRLSDESPTAMMSYLTQESGGAAELQEEGSECDQFEAQNKLLLENLQRKHFSVMGTVGYMAPEMAVLMTNEPQTRQGGYTAVVDWWSLGVTMYKLLYSKKPFSEDNFDNFEEMIKATPGYSMLFQTVHFPPSVEPDTKAIIEAFLDVNEETRLGSGIDGVRNIKQHPYFHDIDWTELERRRLPPPIRPPVVIKFDAKPKSFAEMMKECNKEAYLDMAINPDQQANFSNWNYVSPFAVRVENGIANEMEQFELHAKLRRLTGADEDELHGFASSRSDSVSTLLRSASQGLKNMTESLSSKLPLADYLPLVVEDERIRKKSK